MVQRSPVCKTEKAELHKVVAKNQTPAEKLLARNKSSYLRMVDSAFTNHQLFNAHSLQFGFRAREEGRKLCWGDVSLEKDTDTVQTDYPEIFASQLSGHKHVQSLRNYKQSSISHQRRMSETLSGEAKRFLNNIHQMAPLLFEKINLQQQATL